MQKSKMLAKLGVKRSSVPGCCGQQHELISCCSRIRSRAMSLRIFVAIGALFRLAGKADTEKHLMRRTRPLLPLQLDAASTPPTSKCGFYGLYG